LLRLAYAQLVVPAARGRGGLRHLLAWQAISIIALDESSVDSPPDSFDHKESLPPVFSILTILTILSSFFDTARA
jgi:hypothetical protein